jgi:hypothetical protein
MTCERYDVTASLSTLVAAEILPVETGDAAAAGEWPGSADMVVEAAAPDGEPCAPTDATRSRRSTAKPIARASSQRGNLIEGNFTSVM